MSGRHISGATTVAGVVGLPVRHSLSPLLHNAWLEAAGLDGVYVAFSPPADGFARLIEGLRGGTVRGLNVTLPFKETALALATTATPRAQAAAAANVLVFETDGRILADNTDGIGLLRAMSAQAPGFDPRAAPVAILGAGGGARGAAAALIEAGAPQVRIINRTLSRAAAIATALDGDIVPFPLTEASAAFDGVCAVINATSAGLADEADLDVPLAAAPQTAVAMDMVYHPLLTPFLAKAQGLGLRTVDGLEMLIRQAEPAFEAFFGAPPPQTVNVRALALAALGVNA